MTGSEFAAAVKSAGFTQKDFAETMGVHRTTIADRYAAKKVEPYWVYALAGIVAARASTEVVILAKSA